MPYIKQELREELNEDLNALKLRIMSMIDDPKVDRAGILNYVITDMLDTCYGPLSDAKYRDYNEAIGMLECCKLEFYRKAAAPYEDIKEKQNGKVLDGGSNTGFGLAGKDLTRQQPIPAYSFEHGLKQSPYPVGTFSEEFKHMRELMYPDKNQDISFNITKEECTNGKTDLIFLVRPNDNISIFIRANTYMDATHKLDNIIMEEKLNFKVCDISHYLVAYKKWENLEPEIKNAFEAKERDGLNKNFVIFIKMHVDKQASYPVGTSSEEFKYMRELIYQVDSNESDVNGKVVFKAAINKDLTIFILSGTLEEAEGILNKWTKDQNIVNQSVGHVGYYKKFGELESEVKNAFLAPDNVKIPNFILFTKNKNRSSKKGNE